MSPEDLDTFHTLIVLSLGMAAYYLWRYVRDCKKEFDDLERRKRDRDKRDKKD